MAGWTKQQQEQARTSWVDAVNALVNEVIQWAKDEQWSVHRQDRDHDERLLGQYTVPHLRVVTPFGEVLVEPIARHVLGGDGRVDLRSWPSLNRVKLVRRGDAWEIMTDSNVALGLPWSKTTFLRLAKELQAAA